MCVSQSDFRAKYWECESRLADAQLRVEILNRALKIAIDCGLHTVTEAMRAAEAEHQRDMRLAQDVRLHVSVGRVHAP